MTAYREIDREHVQFDFLVVGTKRGALEAEVERLGGRVARVPDLRSIGPFATVREMRDALVSHGPYDAVHSHVLFASGFALLAGRLAGIKVRVAHSHNTRDRPGGPRRVYEAIARLLIFLCATVLVACDAESGRYLFGRRRFDRHGSVLRNGIDVDTFLRTQRTCRDVVDVDEQALVLLAVSRLEPVKNHAFLIDVVAEIVRKHPRARLLLAGIGSCEEDLRQRIRSLGIDHAVQFLGLRRDIDELLRCADVVVQPSLFEGMPVALVEAQAAGTPVVASDTINPQIDLGLGLVAFLGLEQGAARWAEQIVAQSELVAPAVDERRKVLDAGGYTAKAAARGMVALYDFA
ncbi:glycosyltransferase [Nocardioides sp. CFH 31398]|nr:glycosyltransferase [Nocardioides sp. CFH 31398]